MLNKKKNDANKSESKKKGKKTWKLYINCKFIGNKPEVKVNKLLKWRRKSISKRKKKE